MADKKQTPPKTAVVKYADNPLGRFKKMVDRGNPFEMLPAGIDPDVFKRGVIMAVTKLQGTDGYDPVSLYAGVAELAKDGLIPDGKQAALIPFNKKINGQWTKIFTPIPMVSGILQIAFECGIKNWQVELIREGDDFHYDVANPANTHLKPKWGGGGKIAGVLGVATLPNGEKNVCVMWISEVFKIRDSILGKLKEYTSFNTTKTVEDQIASHVWTLHEEEMIKKTLIRRQIKRLPIIKAHRLHALAQHEDERTMKDMGEVERAAPDTPTPPAPTAQDSDDQQRDILGGGSPTPPAKPASRAEGAADAEVVGDDGMTDSQRAEQEAAFKTVKDAEQDQGGLGLHGGGDGTHGTGDDTGDARPTPPPPSPEDNQ